MLFQPLFDPFYMYFYEFYEQMNYTNLKKLSIFIMEISHVRLVTARELNYTYMHWPNGNVYYIRRDVAFFDRQAFIGNLQILTSDISR